MKKGRQLLRPGKIYELGPASLLTSNIFQKGHRIRVQISGSFFPNLSRHLQSSEMQNEFTSVVNEKHVVLHSCRKTFKFSALSIAPDTRNQIPRHTRANQ